MEVPVPSVSAKQHRFMEMIAHGGKPRAGAGPSQAVAQEFVQADEGARGKYQGVVRKAKAVTKARRFLAGAK